MPRRSLFLRLTSCWLALLVLTTSVGLTVQQHTCYLSGKTQRSLVLTPHHGCAPNASTTAGCSRPAKHKLKRGCCAFSTEHHKLAAQTHQLGQADVAVPALLAVLPQPLSWPAPVAAQWAGTTAARWHAADASPPPRAGRTWLPFACTWRV